SDTGVLSFSIFIFITHKFNIGKGYDNSKFSQKQIDNHIGDKLANNALYYNGNDPNGVPSQCMPCDSSPWIPVTVTTTTTGNFVAVSTSTYTTQTDNAQGAPISKIVVVVQTPYPLATATETTVGNFEAVSSTTYTTTFTNDQGAVTTEIVALVESPYPLATVTETTT
ncbi:hypothetical protein C6P44_002677, partial [Monosporozyma unispora]